MNKRELLIAQRTYEANRMRQERRQLQTAVPSSRRVDKSSVGNSEGGMGASSGTHRPTTMQAQRVDPFTQIPTAVAIEAVLRAKAGGRTRATVPPLRSLEEASSPIAKPTESRPSLGTLPPGAGGGSKGGGDDDAGSYRSIKVQQGGDGACPPVNASARLPNNNSPSDSPLVRELAQRGLTDAAKLRKLTSLARISGADEVESFPSPAHINISGAPKGALGGGGSSSSSSDDITAGSARSPLGAVKPRPPSRIIIDKPSKGSGSSSNNSNGNSGISVTTLSVDIGAASAGGSRGRSNSVGGASLTLSPVVAARKSGTAQDSNGNHSNSNSHDNHSNSYSYSSSGSSGGGTGSKKSDLYDDDNYFMPKVAKLRPDGASLMQVYASRKGDMWGKITAARAREYEEELAEKRRAVEAKNAKYAADLTVQVQDTVASKQRLREAEKKAAGFTQGGMFELIEAAHNARVEVRKQGEMQYIANAIEDIGIKAAQKAVELRQEMVGASVLDRKARREAELERERLAEERRKQKQDQERLFRENAELIAERTRLKELKDEADRAYVKSVEAQLDRDEANRRDAAAKAFSRANNDSQASVVTRTIIEERRRWEEQMYKDIYNGTDILSQQLYASEEAARRREEFQRRALVGEVGTAAAKQERLARERAAEKEEAHRLAEADHAAFLADSQAERQARLAAAGRYQAALTAQLEERRQASLRALQETMSPAERSINKSLMQQLLGTTMDSA